MGEFKGAAKEQIAKIKGDFHHVTGNDAAEAKDAVDQVAGNVEKNVGKLTKKLS